MKFLVYNDCFRGVYLSVVFCVGYIFLLLVLFIDQISKFYVLSILFEHQAPPIRINNFLQIVSVWNEGVSFGFLSWLSEWIIVSFAVVIILSLMFLSYQAKSILVQFAYNIVIGGAAGNLLDRLRFGAVFDFISVHSDKLYFPSFNFADTAITIGFFMLLTECILKKKL